MTPSTELRRVLSNVGAETPPPVTVQIVVECRSAPVERLDCVRAVMALIAEQTSDAWPSDKEWLEKLPAWFTEPFQRRTLKEVMASTALWTFGSWLDAMRVRSWTWWSSRSRPQGWDIFLSAYEWPYSIGALLYLIREAGGESAVVHER
jgi:hypothetical protein